MTDAVVAEIGHNQEPTKYDQLTERRDVLLATARKWLEERPVITDQVMADTAADFLKQLKAFEKEAESERKAEKKPHDDAAKAIQARYAELKDPVKTAEGFIKKKVEAYLKAELKKKQEAERAAREEAERKKREAHEAEMMALQAAQTGDAVDAAGEADRTAEAAVLAEKEADAVANQKTQVHGEFGSAAGLKKTYKAVITDHDTALMHFKDHPDVVAVVQKLANGIARSPASRHQKIPGVEIVEDLKF